MRTQASADGQVQRHRFILSNNLTAVSVAVVAAPHRDHPALLRASRPGPIAPTSNALTSTLWSLRRRVGGCQDVDDDPYHGKQTKRNHLSDQYAIQNEEN